ncbi:MAG: hypothetical protein EPO24_12480 [Bacteroidetes bacterium]|nr:MAG: hypothetical protein EPO24_12480 [Bacteroidota bacterium]
MKRYRIYIVMLILVALPAMSQIKVHSVKGEVLVRHGASETWQQVAVGDILKPDDSMKSGKNSSATIVMSNGKKITVPDQVIVDVSDLRDLTQEEFLLKLAMEDVRSAPLPENDGNINIPRTTTTRGIEKGISASLANNPELGALHLNGTTVLFENGYNATGVLKTKQVYRLYPALSKQVENRMMVASAFEKLELTRDALSEYRNLLKETLSQQQRTEIEKKIETLKKKIDG